MNGEKNQRLGCKRKRKTRHFKRSWRKRRAVRPCQRIDPISLSLFILASAPSLWLHELVLSSTYPITLNIELAIEIAWPQFCPRCVTLISRYCIRVMSELHSLEPCPHFPGQISDVETPHRQITSPISFLPSGPSWRRSYRFQQNGTSLLAEGSIYTCLRSNEISQVNFSCQYTKRWPKVIHPERFSREWKDQSKLAGFTAVI